MSNYKNVDVDKLANIYFGGKVISHSIFFKDGSKKTLGVMLEGGYEFQTSSRELMEIHSGKLNIKIEGAKDWTLIIEGMNLKLRQENSCKSILEN